MSVERRDAWQYPETMGDATREPPRATDQHDGAFVDDGRYGPSALMTPANAVTIIRLLFSPALLVMIVREPSSWLAVGLWFALGFTDGIDGFLARRHGTTRSGAFLDPLADKVLVLGALYALVAAGRFHWLPVVIVSARELAISVYRMHLGRSGLAVPARTLAKVKTVVQELAVFLALLPLTVDHPTVADVALWIAVGFTLVSGAQYFFDGRGAATTLGHRNRAPY
jgi:CDP-diacylglycerol--glycerol-3-phosphate 3-phosphatidyltransferase